VSGLAGRFCNNISFSKKIHIKKHRLFIAHRFPAGKGKGVKWASLFGEKGLGTQSGRAKLILDLNPHVKYNNVIMVF
jgi:hypothetical protein